jgi:2-aminoadipate transaminase
MVLGEVGFMSGASFDFASAFRPGLPAPAVKFAGFPKYNFVGGHNDPDNVPIDGLIKAAASVLKREGTTLATYGLQSGALGYRPLREFLSKKLKGYGGISAGADEILITSGSGSGLDFVANVLAAPGDTVLVEQETYGGALTRLARLPAPSTASNATASARATSTPSRPFRTRPAPSWARRAAPRS